SIYIYDLEMNYLFTAVNHEYENVSRSSYLQATKKFDKKLRKTIRALEELRAEAPDRMLDLIRSETGLGAEERIDDKMSVDAAQEMAESMKQTVEAEVRINGRPTFTKFYDRFLWDLENGMVDASTTKLKEKYPDVWEMAYKEYERRKAS
ncbi:MAG: hypothetical protein L3J47_12110, partial [Sulfurovum sp.]|nr:hypothetical protein [Sulfurovum sp.]